MSNFLLKNIISEYVYDIINGSYYDNKMTMFNNWEYLYIKNIYDINEKYKKL